MACGNGIDIDGDRIRTSVFKGTACLDGWHRLDRGQQAGVGHFGQRLDAGANQLAFLYRDTHETAALLELVKQQILKLRNGAAVAHQFWLLLF